MPDLTNLIETPKAHKDSRRIILDVTPRIKVFSVANTPGIKLGNHYHQDTTELYYVISGKMYCKLQDVTNPDNKTECSVEKGKIITIPLMVAHLIMPDPNTILLGVLGEDFNPRDSYKYEVDF